MIKSSGSYRTTYSLESVGLQKNINKILIYLLIDSSGPGTNNSGSRKKVRIWLKKSIGNKFLVLLTVLNMQYLWHQDRKIHKICPPCSLCSTWKNWKWIHFSTATSLELHKCITALIIGISFGLESGSSYIHRVAGGGAALFGLSRSRFLGPAPAPTPTPTPTLL